MAYYLKDRPEGIPMLNYNPKKSASPRSSPRPSHSTSTTPTPRQASVSSIIAPKIKLVNGCVVIDQDSLHVTSTHLPVDEMTIVNESDRRLTSATFAKRRVISNRWSPKETDLFYEAISMCGTDFSIIETLFPHRSRAQIKGKYKIEERSNPLRLSYALDHKISFDLSFKTKVQTILENEKNK